MQSGGKVASIFPALRARFSAHDRRKDTIPKPVGLGFSAVCADHLCSASVRCVSDLAISSVDSLSNAISEISSGIAGTR
jgi:hypothetical protein